MSELDRVANLQYAQALKDRRSGGVSSLGSDASWIEVKPEFYADARIFSEDALTVFEALPDTHPPYGLTDYRGEPISPSFILSRRDSWRNLSSALRSTGRYVMQETEPRLSSCPYHEVLQEKLGGAHPPLRPYDQNEHGLDAFRDKATPGAMLNSSLFTSLIYRLPRLRRLHGSSTDAETFARNSVSLLREPLAHPQQRAASFVLSLGAISEFYSSGFLNNKLALVYTELEATDNGDRLAWAIPTEQFTLREDWPVQSRVLGSELQFNESTVVYPAGTKLEDIAVDEPTIGCPGNKLAAAMWQRVISVAVAEGLGGYRAR